jgi:uncharacterized membrane protein YadS
MLSATTLVTEAAVLLFAALVSHQLNPGDRVLVWTLAIVLAILLTAIGGLLPRLNSAWPYVVAAVLQIGVILLGLWVPAMWFFGVGLAALYVFGVIWGHRKDAEKDAVDEAYWREHPEQRPVR